MTLHMGFCVSMTTVVSGKNSLATTRPIPKVWACEDKRAWAKMGTFLFGNSSRQYTPLRTSSDEEESVHEKSVRNQETPGKLITGYHGVAQAERGCSSKYWCLTNAILLSLSSIMFILSFRSQGIAQPGNRLLRQMSMPCEWPPTRFSRRRD